jgi:hypothetical protein
LRSHLKCKGQNNEDKEYLEPIGDPKMKPSQKKSLHPKPLGSKSPSNPPHPKRNQTKIKKRKGRRVSWKKILFCCYRSSPMMVGLVVVRTQQWLSSKKVGMNWK